MGRKVHKLHPNLAREQGKIQGRINAGSGHMAEISTFESRSRGGKIVGRNHVASGHWASLRTREHQRAASKIANEKNHALKDVRGKSVLAVKMGRAGGKIGGKIGGKRSGFIRRIKGLVRAVVTADLAFGEYFIARSNRDAAA
jgi:hypothetical protein